MTVRQAQDERADLLAYLEQRRDNAVLMALRFPHFEDQARERERQLGVMIDEFTAGLHVGAAEARAALLRWAGEAEVSEPALPFELDHAAIVAATTESNTFNQETSDGGTDGATAEG